MDNSLKSEGISQHCPTVFRKGILQIVNLLLSFGKWYQIIKGFQEERSGVLKTSLGQWERGRCFDIGDAT